MEDWLPTVLATIAGILSTSSFVPQVLKAWRERDTAAISKGMYIVTVTAFVLWSAYGFLIGALPLIIFNLLSLVLSATILVLKIRNDRQRTRTPSAASTSRREPEAARPG
ncbi:SemiSWEET family sugar transporter [Microvirga arabica]|uniref:SemiSWEET family sugar transporter n=1 Tax=Microvirga arabica TaxID=1128671 RepID=A0ABV6YHG4_9HYPH